MIQFPDVGLGGGEGEGTTSTCPTRSPDITSLDFTCGVMSKTEKTPANDIEHLKEKSHKAESSVSLGLEATFIRLVVLRKNTDDHIDTYSFRSLNSIILCLSKI